jgi:hypothetical protein
MFKRTQGEINEAAHSTEEDSINSVSKADDVGPTGKKRKSDKPGGDKTADKADKSASGTPAKGTYKEDFSELTDEDESLTEDFKRKAATIFESAVTNAITEQKESMQEAYDSELEESKNEFAEDLVEKVDGYLQFVVEKFMTENALAIESGIKTEIAEGFMSGLKTLFEESYVEVPESKVDLVDELSEKVESMEAQINEITIEAIALKEEKEVLEKDFVIREASEGLASTQVDKLRSLAENIDYEDADTFAQKVEDLKESMFSAPKTPTSLSEEKTDVSSEVSSNDNSTMGQYLKAIRDANKTF